MKQYGFFDILNAQLGGNGKGNIKASFTKKSSIKPYETEDIVYSVELGDTEGVVGAERVLTLSVLEAQLELTAYTNHLQRHLVTQEEYNNRVAEITTAINYLASVYESLTGKDSAVLFSTVADNMGNTN